MVIGPMRCIVIEFLVFGSAGEEPSKGLKGGENAQGLKGGENARNCISFSIMETVIFEKGGLGR